MIKQIGTVAVYVEDQQKAKQFWTEKVGFDIAADHPMGPEASWLEAKRSRDSFSHLPESHDERLRANEGFYCV